MYNDVVRTKVLYQTPNPSALVRHFCLVFFVCFKRVEIKLVPGVQMVECGANLGSWKTIGEVAPSPQSKRPEQS